jgi:hypothetical protein
VKSEEMGKWSDRVMCTRDCEVEGGDDGLYSHRDAGDDDDDDALLNKPIEVPSSSNRKAAATSRTNSFCTKHCVIVCVCMTVGVRL